MQRSRRVLLLALLAVVALFAGACSSSSSSTNSSTKTTTTTAPALKGTITVSAAASLTKSFGALATAFEAAHPGTKVTLNFGSSGTLATQILSGAPADVAAFADTKPMGQLDDKSLLAAPSAVFAKNHLVIVTKPGNPGKIKTLADLATVKTLSLCDATAPCGKFADQILAGANVTVPASKVTRGADVKATLAAVTQGDADAAIVYVTDAQAAGSAVTAVTIPDAQNATASYPIAALKASGHLDVAKAFVAYVESPAGQAMLHDAGFLKP